MKLTDFNYELPDELIAQFPAAERDRSRLLVLRREGGTIELRNFYEIPDYLDPGDALVINDTKVFPARLFGRKDTGGKVEVLLLERVGSGAEIGDGRKEEWTCLVNSAKKTREGARICFTDDLCGEILSREGEIYRIALRSAEKLKDTIRRRGFTPLPPYIKRSEPDRFEKFDRERYQAVYAREEGAAAAPTAGLHFTESLLQKIREKGIRIIPLTLRIGFATFNPVREHDIEKHRMHSEYCRMTEESAREINATRKNGGDIFAVGTTAVRTLEFFADPDGTIRAGEGMNSLFIYPGYTFKTVDHLITNFHLPQSTLLMLVSAFAGRDNIFRAYREAISERYRFYSYGDSMLII